MAVVGGGIIGLCTAEAAQRRGLTVVCLEAGVPGARESGGAGRVLRHVHADPRLVGLTRRSAAGWRALGQRTGTTLLGREGVLVVGATEADVAGLAAAGVDHDPDHPTAPTLGPGAAAALLDREGGAVAAASAIEALVGALGDRLVHEHVHRIVPEGSDGASVVGDRVLVRAGAVLVCAGTGTPSLARESGLEIGLRTEQHIRVAFRIRAGAAALPCLLDRSGTYGERVYGLPLPGTDLYAVGVHGQEAAAPRTTIDRAAAYVARALPALDPHPAAIRTCTSSNLADEHDDAFRAWREGRVWAFAGGNLFKHAPVIGEALVAAACGEAQTDVPVVEPVSIPAG